MAGRTTVPAYQMHYGNDDASGRESQYIDRMGTCLLFSSPYLRKSART